MSSTLTNNQVQEAIVFTNKVLHLRWGVLWRQSFATVGQSYKSAHFGRLRLILQLFHEITVKFHVPGGRTWSDPVELSNCPAYPQVESLKLTDANWLIK